MAVYHYTYTGKENIDIEDFLDPSNRLFFRALPIDVFQRFDDDTGMTNAERIFAVYTEDEKVVHQGAFDLFVLPFIKPGTDLILPTDRITIENLTLYGDNQFLTQVDFTTYWSDNYNALIQDPLFVQSEKLTRRGIHTDVQINNENIRVWVWIAALNQIYDISPYVRRVTTSKNFEVGAFTLTIDPVLPSSLTTTDAPNPLYTNLDIINVYPLNQAGEGSTNDFFEINLQYNDLVFIRYETLALEQPLIGEQRDIKIGSSQLPGQVWDMIGLVDTVSVARSNQNTDKVTQVGGRDLMKLLIDDASYFIPTVFRTGGDLSFVFSGNEEEAYFRRNIINGAFQHYFNYGEKSIRDTLGFIVNHLANLRIVNDDLFFSYGDRRSTRYTVTGADENYIETLQVAGIWQIIKLFIDPLIDERRIADDSLANPDGSLISYVNRICQDPFVEFYGDTNGDQYDFIARQAPLTGSAIRAIVGAGPVPNDDAPVNGGFINILEKDILNYTLDWETRYYSWYQIQAQNVFMGASDASSLSIVPIIWLPPYVEKFGNKRYIVQDNYFSSRSLKGDEDSKSLNIGLYQRKVLNDLKYIIDINAYLPFTRRGTITLIGDRRIKIGTFVRFAPTDELYYVVGVNNSATFTKGVIERVTTLTVERGMVIDYIRGVRNPEGFPLIQSTRPDLVGNSLITTKFTYSYFNIVDTNLIINTIIRNLSDQPAVQIDRVVSTDFGVNSSIFDFFVQRQQFKQ